MFQGGEKNSTDYISSFANSYQTTKKNGDKDKNYKPLVEAYYDIATDFYIYGWGSSFHFAPRLKGESFKSSIVRHEHWLASQLNVRPGQQIIDLGCGVCGPLVNLAKFTRCNMTGVTIDQYQVDKGNKYIERNGLSTSCKAVKGDFHQLTDIESNSFDAGYDIEASAHSTELSKFFSEIERVLKPGCFFAGYAWVTTNKYEPGNSEHEEIMQKIAYGNGLTVINSFQDYKDAIAANPNLELVDEYDVAKLDCDFVWYDPLLPKWSTPDGLLATKAGRMFTAMFTKCLETLGLAPSGSYQTTKVLEDAAEGLVSGGMKGLYTPMHFYRVRKLK